MTVVDLLCLLAVLVLAGVTLMRWVWVSQLEHYIPGSCATVLLRWVTVVPRDRVLLIAAVVAEVVAVVAGGTVGAVLAVVAAAVGSLLPSGMPWLARGHLRWTRRARTLAVVAVVPVLVVVLAAWLLGWPGLAALVVGPTIALCVDGAAQALRPVEARLAQRFVDQARATLERHAPTVVAITGSYGKTSTKNHVGDLLGATVPHVVSPASWNNTAGVSRTINERLTPQAKVLVLEMGTYGPGEIAEMVAWTHPEIAVITEIGPMHLERMGSLDAIASAKAEILTEARVAVLMVDNPRLSVLADAQQGERTVVRVGTDPDREDLDVRVVALEEAATAAGQAGEERGTPVRVDTPQGSFTSSLPPGVHPSNAACAVAVALELGIRTDDIAARLPSLVMPDHRKGIATSPSGVTVVDDTFNANPQGAAETVALLGDHVEGRRAVVTPGFVEMGPQAREANEQLGRLVREADATLVVVGRVNRAALTRGYGEGAVVVPDRQQAADWVRGTLGQGDGVAWINDLPPHYP